MTQTTATPNQPWISRGPAQDACELQLAPLLATSADPTERTLGQLLVLACLLEEALKVVRVVIADSVDEEFDLQQLVDQGNAAVKAVLLQSMNATNDRAGTGPVHE